MTCKLRMSEVRRMILRSNVIMLQDPSRIEVIHKALRTLTLFIQTAIIEMAHDILDLVQESRALDPGITDLAEARPEGDDDDLGVRPAGVDFVD